MSSTPKRPRRVENWRNVLIKEKDREVDWLLKIQSYRTPFLDRYFRIASLLGEELFLILFLPLSGWIVSTQFAAHSTILLAMAVGIGNILKNFFLVPRPPHPPVWVPHESEKDHGLPSTHTMTAITLPWYLIIYYNYMEPISPLPSFAVPLAVLWTLSVMMSRMYQGHHTPMDVGVGALLGLAFLLVWQFHLRPLADFFFVNATWKGVFTVIGTGVCILAFHPVPPKVKTPAYAETGLVIGTATGACLGVWFQSLYTPLSIYSLYTSSPPPQFALFLSYPILVYILRFVVGVLIVVLAKTVVKKLGTSFVMWVASSVFSTKYTKNHFKYSEAEAAVKYITYTAIGVSTTWIAPVVFAFLGLHLPVDDIMLLKP